MYLEGRVVCVRPEHSKRVVPPVAVLGWCPGNLFVIVVERNGEIAFANEDAAT